MTKFLSQAMKLYPPAAWRVAPAMPTLITAGKPDGVSVPVRVTNPFQNVAVARFQLSGFAGVAPQNIEVTLAPGQSKTTEFKATVFERSTQQIQAIAACNWMIETTPGKATSLGRWSEPLDFQITNPLKLDCAPTAAGLQVSISNPARDPFVGQLQVGEAAHPIQLTHSQPDASLTLAGITASTQFELRDADDHRVASAPAATFRSLEVPQFKTALDGDAKIPATASLTLIDAPTADAPFPQVWKLDYQFSAGWRFLRCVPLAAAGTPGQPIPIPGKPTALGIWIHGDNSNNALRMRVIDASGQTFQLSGPNLNWKGWRWIAFDLTDLKHAAHWGGPDDGVPHGDFRLDCPFLLDGSRRETKGTIYFAGMAWIGMQQSSPR